MSEFIDVHADDYGLSAHSDKMILELLEEGKLDSLSFIANFSRFKAAADELAAARAKRQKPVLVSAHLNFVEGRCLAPASEVADLVDGDGFFSVTWEKLFLWNFNPLKRARIRAQLTKEIIAQTEVLIAAGAVDRARVRFDSHQHTHMIPLVLEALLAAIKERKYGVEFIRNTQDPLAFYAGDFRRDFGSINVIKCLILNFFSWAKVRGELRKMGFAPSLLCGVFFSGKMDERTAKILPVFENRASEEGRVCEALFHPCLMLESEIGAEFNSAAINEFHLSPNRTLEYETVRNLF